VHSLSHSRRSLQTCETFGERSWIRTRLWFCPCNGLAKISRFTACVRNQRLMNGPNAYLGAKPSCLGSVVQPLYNQMIVPTSISNRLEHCPRMGTRRMRHHSRSDSCLIGVSHFLAYFGPNESYCHPWAGHGSRQSFGLCRASSCGNKPWNASFPNSSLPLSGLR
jgi:hypothetical protein